MFDFPWTDKYGGFPEWEKSNYSYKIKFLIVYVWRELFRSRIGGDDPSGRRDFWQVAHGHGEISQFPSIDKVTT